MDETGSRLLVADLVAQRARSWPQDWQSNRSLVQFSLLWGRDGQVPLRRSQQVPIDMGRSCFQVEVCSGGYQFATLDLLEVCFAEDVSFEYTPTSGTLDTFHKHSRLTGQASPIPGRPLLATAVGAPSRSYADLSANSSAEARYLSQRRHLE